MVNAASVTLSDGSNVIDTAITNNGECTFTGVSPGTYNVRVAAAGYDTLTETITVSKTNTSFTISVTPVSADPVDYLATLTLQNSIDEPIEGASVVIDEQTVTSDSDGEASFNLYEGQYDVTITCEGYKTYTERITITSSGENNFEMYLMGWDVNILVTDNEDNPLEGITVILNTVEGVTLQDGTCSFTDVFSANGLYSVEIYEDGYASYNENITVLGDEETVTVVLQPQ